MVKSIYPALLLDHFEFDNGLFRLLRTHDQGLWITGAPIHHPNSINSFPISSLKDFYTFMDNVTGEQDD